MTITPIARQSTLVGGHGLQKKGTADAADSEIAASKGSKAVPAAGAEGAELEQQSQPREALVRDRATARPAAQSKDVVAEAAVAATSPRPAREHSATANRGSAKANAAKEAGQQATPADAASPAATPIAGRPRSGSNDASDPKQGESDGRSTSREARRTDPLAASAKVSIIAEQAAPAPGRCLAQRQRSGDRRRHRRQLRLASGDASVVRAACGEPDTPTNARTQDPTAPFGAGCCNGASTNRR